MIAFFRKIRRRLLQDNKITSYVLYAIGEIILVVLGILIALGINNWNENRKDRSLEETYLKRFLDDLEEEDVYVQSFIIYNKRVNDHANKAVLYFEDPSIAMVNPTQSLVDIYQASQFNDARTTASTYKELNASGQINLLQNQRLRSMLINFYELDWISSVVFEIPNRYRENVRRVMPNDIQKKIRAKCGDIYVETKNSISVELPENCFVDLSNEEAELVIKNILDDEGIKGDLNFLIGNMESKLAYMEYVQKQLKGLIMALEKVKE
jgi:hypothetical protein